MKITAHMTHRERLAFQAGRAVEAALAWRARRRLLRLSGLPNMGGIELCTQGARDSVTYARLQLSRLEGPIPTEPMHREEWLDDVLERKTA